MGLSCAQNNSHLKEQKSKFIKDSFLTDTNIY